MSSLTSLEAILMFNDFIAEAIEYIQGERGTEREDGESKAIEVA